MTTSEKPRRQRLDALLVERGLAETRTKAQALIIAGKVFDGNGQRLERA
jgi:23S rRNA (cytidine1920-2'-O)/16S rRNA (cytidine1409-2'-O)-methyltransferase